MADGQCEICGGDKRVVIDDHEFCCMGHAKQWQEESWRPEREVLVGEGKE